MPRTNQLYLELTPLPSAQAITWNLKFQVSAKTQGLAWCSHIFHPACCGICRLQSPMFSLHRVVTFSTGKIVFLEVDFILLYPAQIPGEMRGIRDES